MVCCAAQAARYWQWRDTRFPLLGQGTRAPESRVGFNVLLSVAWSLSTSQGHDSLRHEGGGRARIFHQWFGCHGGRIGVSGFCYSAGLVVVSFMFRRLFVVAGVCWFLHNECTLLVK